MKNLTYNWFYNPVLLFALATGGIGIITISFILAFFLGYFGLILIATGVIFVAWAVIGSVCYFADSVSRFKSAKDLKTMGIAIGLPILIGWMIITWWEWFLTRDFSLL